jgi:hypothetical protein
VRDQLRDHIFTAHWLNYLNDNLAEKIGGYKAIAKVLEGARVKKLPAGVLIRGAELPPVGDVNRGAADLGCLPDVARALKPLRAEISAFGDPHFDAGQWLGRLDDLPSRPWSNRRAAEAV